MVVVVVVVVVVVGVGVGVGVVVVVVFKDFCLSDQGRQNIMHELYLDDCR